MNPIEDPVLSRYTSGEYATRNPDWDRADSPWKAGQVSQILDRNRISPCSIVEIGCGAGGILSHLRQRYPHAELTGYDIAPQLPEFWKSHETANIRFVLGDYFEESASIPDTILVLDVIEHLGNPFDFLVRLSKCSKYVVLHIPLDLSSISVLRESPLLRVRHKTGHLHYFTKSIALALLDECGFEIVEARLTGASFTAPQHRWKTRLAAIVRRLVCAIMGEAGVRLLGGETLIVVARPKGQ